MAETETKTTETTQNAEITDYKAEFERMQGEYEKLKRSFDTASSDVAEYKRKERARMTEDEQKAAADAEREAHYKDLERRIAMSDYSAELDDIADSKARTEIVEFLADGKIVDALKKFKEFRAKDRTEMEKRIKADLMKQNPEFSASNGTGSAKTKEEIMAIKDAAERQKAISENPHLFI